MNGFEQSGSETNDRQVVRFRQPFSEKYTLTVTTDIQAASFPIATKAQIRWALRVIDVDRNGQADIELITIENQLLETNNKNFNDIAALNSLGLQQLRQLICLAL